MVILATTPGSKVSSVKVFSWPRRHHRREGRDGNEPAPNCCRWLMSEFSPARSRPLMTSPSGSAGPEMRNAQASLLERGTHAIAAVHSVIRKEPRQDRV
jgi:hypothetical protein